MKRCVSILLLAAGSLTGIVTSLVPSSSSPSHQLCETRTTSTHRYAAPTSSFQSANDAGAVSTRRNWMGRVASAGAALLTMQGALMAGTGSASAAATTTAAAAPMVMVTTDEFLIILRDSARSIQVVEFSGPKSETATVRLVDGTAFGIKDVIESPTDPRSPLRIAAYCRENQVPTRFLTIEAALASAPKRKKVYTNQRVAEANEKEKERLARMEADEQARLAELYKLQGEDPAVSNQ